MKVSVGSEMARNENENEFRTSKMVTGIHFEKISNLSFDLQWREMQEKPVSFRNLGHLLFVEHNSDQYPENKYIEVYKCWDFPVLLPQIIFEGALIYDSILLFLFLVKILQYTKNFLGSMKTKQICICFACWKY
jgi:hypothetical protein